MGRRVLLLVNHDKPDAAEAATRVRAAIELHGEVVAELEADHSGTIDEAHNAELVVVLGGDGTLLSQTRRCLGLGLPMLGVNLGKLGFMAEFDEDSVEAQAGELFGGAPLTFREVALLRATAARNGATMFDDLALNECVVTAGPPYRMIELNLSIDGETGPDIAGDGLIVSTPVGSTAYTLSAGGPILAPDVDAFAITPIAVHTLSFRPIVVAGSSTIELLMRRVNAENGAGTTLMLDGQTVSPLEEGDVVRIVRHDVRARFVRNTRMGYWQRLNQKLNWAARPALRRGE